MVARNLERGSGFFWPQLDTAPFPNYFVVEPPLYQSVAVTLRRCIGLGMGAAGRIASALAMTLGALGLFALVRKRSGDRAALLATFAFLILPLTIRYGRAFQPDALMLGTVLAGLACWDQPQSRRGPWWHIAGWSLLAFGIAVKIIAAFLLVPFCLANERMRRPRYLAALLATLLPALAWYAWAYHLIEAGAGSRASADNRAIWLHMVGPLALFKQDTLIWVARFLLVRAFTPVGAALAIAGFWKWRNDSDRLFPLWAISTLFVMAALAGKLHHEYYWLFLAPPVAFAIGTALDRITRRSYRLAALAGLAVICLIQVRSTWRMPAEWTDLKPAARAVAAVVSPEKWVASPEALLYEADRRGCRMEWTAQASRRAAGEWQADSGRVVDSPSDLLAFYRQRGARYFADLGHPEGDPNRMALHDFVRRRYKVIVDCPEVIVADLVNSETRPHGN